MKWFRANIRHGSRLALFALVVQFVLSFGHFHAVQAQGSAENWIATSFLERSSHTTSDADRDSGLAADLCPVCAVVALIGAATLSQPPSLPTRAADDYRYPAATAYVASVGIGYAPFRARGPPTSQSFSA
jgi:hypothetical protein